MISTPTLSCPVCTHTYTHTHTLTSSHTLLPVNIVCKGMFYLLSRNRGSWKEKRNITEANGFNMLLKPTV